jgi:tetratricopeptide (TPR) repeat protein
LEAPACERQVLAGNAALRARNYSEAERLSLSALAVCQGQGSADDKVAQALANIAFAKTGLGLHGDAADFLRRSIAIFEKQPSEYQKDLIALHGALGRSFAYQHLYRRAEEAYGTALDLATRTASVDQLTMFDLLSSLGSVYSDQGRYKEAEAALGRARKALGSMDSADPLRRAALPQQVILLVNLGNLYHRQGLGAEALAAFREGVELVAEVENPAFGLVATLLNNLAAEYMERSDYSAAEALLARAVSELERGTPLAKQDVAQILNNYRTCLRKSGSRQQARDFDARAGRILNSLPRLPSDDFVIDVSRLKNEKR